MERSGNFYKAIQLGYILISILIGCMVKYVYFTGYFLNAVGDKCRNEVGGSTVWKYTGVGPISRIPDTPDNFGTYIKRFRSDPPFYSKNARKLILSSVTIEYMNGKKIVLSGSELEDRVDYQY